MRTLHLTKEQRQLVEAHLDLVRGVIFSVVRKPYQSGALSFDDLLQTGFMALCEAAVDFDPGRGSPFATFARVVIRNDLFGVLNKAQRYYALPLHTDIPEAHEESLEETPSYESLMLAARRMRSRTARQGVEALILLAAGYSREDIGRRFRAPVPRVSSWIEEARASLMGDVEFLNGIGRTALAGDLIPA